MKVLKENEINGKTSGSSLKWYIDCTYQELIKALGDPTYSTPSGDRKVQKEWVVEHNGEIFTVYDWKTYDEDYTMNKLDEFHVGGKTSADVFILELEELISKEYSA